MNKFLKSLFCILAFVMLLSNTIICSASAKSTGINVNYHTAQEIRNYLIDKKIDLEQKSSYAVKPSVSNPYKAGQLSDSTLKSALNTVNAVRYIAGIDANLKLNANYNKMAQAAALLNAANDELTHYPSKPSGMDSSLYDLGYEGASSSNIAWTSWETGLGYNIMYQWMDDGDNYNIDRVGHRRWILNPTMKEIGFGQVTENGTYAAMYAFDNAFGNTSYYGVAWPAQNIPIDYWEDSYPWSISMGYSVDASAIKVTLIRESDSKKWVFSNNSSNGYFNVENSNYGQKGCIIFRPDNITYKAGDQFTVKITGLNETVSYQVKFFSLGCTHSYKTATVTKKATSSANGKLTAVCKNCGHKKITTVYKIFSVALSKKTVTYNGKVQKPAVIVKNSNGKTISSNYYTVTYNNTKNVGIGKVTVTFKGRYSGTKNLELKIQPKKVNITNLQAIKKGFKVNYSKGSYITHYQIEYSTNSKFSSSKKVNLAKSSAKKKTIKNLKSGKTYYIRIRCYKKMTINGTSRTVYSKWSDVKKIKTLK